MVERIFIIDNRQPRLDAAAARRQFSLSMAVGFAVLAAAAVAQLQSAPSARVAGPAHQTHAQTVDYALATTTIGRN
jgi:hypothetical protein